MIFERSTTYDEWILLHIFKNEKELFKTEIDRPLTEQFGAVRNLLLR